MRRAFAAVLLLTVAASASDPKHKPEEVGQRNVGKGVNFYSLEKEIALGREMAGQVELESRILDDPVVSEYVNRLGQILVRNSDAKVPFTIKVIESPEINAFALPGGFFFVNTGLILKARDESELAGVMAHEIAHVAARHGTRQATRVSIMNYATIPLIFLGGSAGYAVRQAATLAMPLGFLQFSRGMESEADQLGLQYMYSAGYDPSAFVNFFERIQTLEKRKPGVVSKLFSSHPMTKDRIRATQKQIERELEPRDEYVVDTSEFASIHERLVRLEQRNRASYDDLNRPVLLHRTGGR